MQAPGIPSYWAIYTGDTEWEMLSSLAVNTSTKGT